MSLEVETFSLDPSYVFLPLVSPMFSKVNLRIMFIDTETADSFPFDGDTSLETKGKSTMTGLILKRFEKPDEVRVFDKGKFEIVQVGGLTIGRASYEPGWKWSQHVAPIAGKALCYVEHVGMVVSDVPWPPSPMERKRN